MPRNKVGKRKDPPVFRKPFPAFSPEKAAAAPADQITPREGKKAKMKTAFGRTLANMEPDKLRNLLDECMEQSLVPKEPINPAIYKRVARKNRQWEQPFNVPEIPGYTAPNEQDERKVKRFRRSLVQIILDEAIEDDASVPTPEVQHHPDPGPSTNPKATGKAVFKLSQATDSEGVVEVGSSRGA